MTFSHVLVKIELEHIRFINFNIQVSKFLKKKEKNLLILKMRLLSALY